jgi:hypothetical protein
VEKMNQPRPTNSQQHMTLIQNQIADLFKLVNVRTEDIIVRQHKLQIDINDMKQFLKTKFGAPDASRLKDLMNARLKQERFDYRG